MLVLSKCWHCADNVDIRWNVQYKSDKNFSCNSINRVFQWMIWIQLSFFLVFTLNLLIIDTLEATDVIDLSQGQRDKNNGIFIIFEKCFRTNHCYDCYSGNINSKMTNLYRKRACETLLKWIKESNSWHFDFVLLSINTNKFMHSHRFSSLWFLFQADNNIRSDDHKNRII